MYTLGKNLLTLDSVSLSFGSNLILRDINLTVKDIVRSEVTGQVITLIGESGIGKTQLLKMIAGLQEPTTGTIKIGPDQINTKAGIVGLVDQKYPLFQHRTLKSNLKLVSADKDKISAYLAEFNLWDHQDKYPAQLSGGQRQRAAIVQQLLCSEHFILLDEPFSGLDLKAIDKLLDVINKISRLDEFIVIIISSHILEPSLAISDEAWLLGFQYDNNVKIPGATIKKTYDMASTGLAWRPDIRRDPEFIQFVHQVEETFKSF